jgi:hypothetical protein
VRVDRAQLHKFDPDLSDRGLDLDSHADKAVLGFNCFVFEVTGRTVNVYSYDPKLGWTATQVVLGSFAYDDKNTTQVVLLIVHQGLDIPHSPYSLPPPFQLQENGVVVNDRPKFLTVTPTIDDHPLLVPSDDPIPYRIPMLFRGTASYIDVRLPIKSEVWNPDLLRLELTSKTPEKK